MYLLISIFLFANEPAATPAPEAASAAAKKVPGWVELQGDLQTMQGKIGVAQTNLEKLLLQKRNVQQGSKEARFVVEELVKAHRHYRKMLEDYRQKEAVLKFRYPERGLREPLKFTVPEAKELNELEKEVGVDATLSETMKMVRSQYGSEERKPAATAVPKTKPEEKKSVLESPAPQL